MNVEDVAGMQAVASLNSELPSKPADNPEAEFEPRVSEQAMETFKETFGNLTNIVRDLVSQVNMIEMMFGNEEEAKRDKDHA